MDGPEHAAIVCGDADVASLLRFVEARSWEPQATRLRFSGEDRAEIEVLGQVLLERARNTCRPDEHCRLSAGELRALRRLAELHDDHPEFEPGWRVPV